MNTEKGKILFITKRIVILLLNCIFLIFLSFTIVLNLKDIASFDVIYFMKNIFKEHNTELADIQVKLPSGFIFHEAPEYKDDHVIYELVNYRNEELAFRKLLCYCDSISAQNIKSDFIRRMETCIGFGCFGVISHYKIDECDLFLYHIEPQGSVGYFKYAYYVVIPDKCLMIAYGGKNVDIDDFFSIIADNVLDTSANEIEFVRIAN